MMIEDLEKVDPVILQFVPSYLVEAIKPMAFRPHPWRHNQSGSIHLAASVGANDDAGYCA
jgi:hypothetical protein